MQVLEFDQETAWLEGGGATGFDPGGWEASTWVAHSIYECSEKDPAESHDDVRRARLSAGLEEPLMIGDVNFDEVGILTGGCLGIDSPLSGDWQRISWVELADRTGPGFADETFAPCFKWFPYRSWPSSLEPPTEGSLDVASLDALIEHLLVTGPDDDCFACYGLLSARSRSVSGDCYRGPISRVADLVDLEAGRTSTPSNFWAVDRSWFVYTDWDLWATKVSGSRALIDAIVADENLETLVWPTDG